MWGVLVLNIILLVVVLVFLAGVFALRDAIGRIEQQMAQLVQEVDSSLPQSSRQIGEGHEKIVALRKLLKAVPSYLAQIPKVPGYVKQGTTMLNKVLGK
jgi:hypothetical protein